MLITTTELVQGRNYQVLGLVRGSTVQSKHIGKDLLAGFKNMVGGELNAYTEMLNEAREIATERMVAQATSFGADAIVAVRFASAGIMDGAAEVMAYGTAVKLL
ncbi:heavy metal-binding domain-containing protein [Ruminococcaceae bacterium OttesenSCG-928-D13]|nr:heavy metal-binding domain-containing protein [Ruminococcaceae bacterium OttesenSCG-928-D13]